MLSEPANNSEVASEYDDGVIVAAIQMASGPSVDANLEEATRHIEDAVSQQAKLVVLPEYFCIMGMKDTDKLLVKEEFGEGPIQRFLSETAKRLGIWLVGGSVPLVSPDPEKIYNSCLVYADDGNLAARYNKIHLFGLSMGKENYAEDKTIMAGDEVVTLA
ncbi:nitrilase-related carbon-nitrogen hydrolase, partial [Nitrosomonas sp.]|uniref:nitrilase-related carbon-nitrogen hydrolase n=1 Tax=Nitrosomonas sp. TaxID=42353 RepID=UPI002844DFE7